MKTLSKVLTAAVLSAAIATPALAWGEREQGALAGIVGTLILQQIARDGQAVPPQPAPRPPVVQPQVVYPPVVYAPPIVVPVYPPVYHRHHGQAQRPMWRRVDVYIPECNCTRTIDVQIQ